MAYLELTDTKVWKLFKEMIGETYDDNEADKLMKFALKTVNGWSGDALEVSTLKKMKKMADARLKEYGEL